jgi:hypothetical protein
MTADLWPVATNDQRPEVASLRHSSIYARMSVYLDLPYPRFIIPISGGKTSKYMPRGTKMMRTRKPRVISFVPVVGSDSRTNHFGVLARGYERRVAGTAERVIATVLLAGFALSWLSPTQTRAIVLVAQGFALLGTLVGVLTIAIGIGPRTVPDLAYHVTILIVLAWGLSAPARTPADEVGVLS